MAVEPLSRHIITSVGALQAEERWNLRTLQALLVSFFIWYSCNAMLSSKSR